jgi:osmotically-inducible protein OsmY
MKTDREIQRDVADEIRWDPSLTGTEIGVAAKEGVITLSGRVDSYAQKVAAERAAERVSGVRAIAEDLQVKLADSSVRTDTDIAHAALHALAWDIQVPNDKLKVRVEDAWVTMEGDVDWQFQKQAAERSVRYLTGVRGVINSIHVKPTISTVDVKERIEKALKRSAELDSRSIAVQAADGKITLVGSVRSWAERMDAERAAWSAPGVREVKDELRIMV